MLQAMTGYEYHGLRFFTALIAASRSWELKNTFLLHLIGNLVKIVFSHVRILQ